MKIVCEVKTSNDTSSFHQFIFHLMTSLPLYKDDIVENTIQMNIQAFNNYAEDILNSSFRKLTAMLTDDECRRYTFLWPHLQIPNIRRKIISFIKVNPCFITTNHDLLFQRICFYEKNYGSLANQIYPFPFNPIQNVFNQLNSE